LKTSKLRPNGPQCAKNGGRLAGVLLVTLGWSASTRAQTIEIARIKPIPSITEFAVQNRNSFPANVTAGRNGGPEFSESNADEIGRVTTSGITELRRPAGGDAPSEVLNVDSRPTEPAVPLNLALEIRVFAAKRLIEITVTVAKRSGYPTDLFFDRDVTAQISLLPGLQLEDGSLSWSGDLKGNQVAKFVAKVRAVHDTDGLIEASAIGHALGGRIDADKERFHVLVRGEQMHVSPEPPMTVSPLRPGTGSPAK
jgi:hypothetical protein